MRARPPRLPDITFGARLGGGPTCDVYSAFDTSGRPGWAVKILREDAAADPTNIQLLRQEGRIGMAVRHANLVRVLRLGPEEDWPRYLVMERVPGHSVRRVLNERQWLSASLATSIARQTACALAALHAAGYVHGDVKPDNLHLNVDRKCTLLDLGFAHRADSDSFVNGYVLGTANYVAPELCDQPEHDTPSADIFSLGVTLFEVLTGVLPYPSGGVEQTMLRHRDHRPDSLTDWEGAWSTGLSHLVDQMLSRDPARRPTAAVVSCELSELERRLSRTSSAA